MWLAPIAGAVALATFPAVAGAASPTPTPCPVTGSSPCYTALPTILPANEVGNPPEGRILNVTTGTWNGSPTRYTYDWQRCTGTSCVDTGDINTTYTVTSADINSTLQVVVTAYNAAGTGQAVTTPTGPAVQAAPINRAAPTISGPAQVGQTLSVGPGTWAGTMPINYAYQWKRCNTSALACSPIAGATSTAYSAQNADIGHTLVALVTATNSAGTSSTNSHPSAVVAPSNSGTPGNAGTSGNSGTSHNTGTPTSGGNAHNGASPAKLRALLGNILTAHGAGARIRALLKHGGYSFAFAAPSPGRLLIAWNHRQHGTTVLIAIVNVVFHKAGKDTMVKLALTGKGRRLLRGASTMKLIAVARFTPAGKGTTGATRRLTLTR